MKEYATRKELQYQKICEADQENLHLTSGLVPFLDTLKERGVPLYICTASMEPNVLWYLKVFELDGEKDALSQNLPYGKQRKLEIARALATNPKLLLLDEPAAGMNPNETAELMETIRFVRDEFDMTILLIEHDMKLVSGICEELTVLNFGQELAHGETSAVLNDPKVITAYLGE